jgi:hypothetical protein
MIARFYISDNDSTRMLASVRTGCRLQRGDVVWCNDEATRLPGQEPLRIKMEVVDVRWDFTASDGPIMEVTGSCE